MCKALPTLCRQGFVFILVKVLTTQNGKPTLQNGMLTTQNGKPTLQNGMATAQNGKPTLQNGMATAQNGKPTLQNGMATELLVLKQLQPCLYA